MAHVATSQDKQGLVVSKPPREKLNVRLSRDGVAELDRLAEAEHRTRSAMIRLLLVEAMNARQKVEGWRCECHPNAHWGYFAKYPDCPISDLNYGDPATTTYGNSFASLTELQAAHVGVTHCLTPKGWKL